MTTVTPVVKWAQRSSADDASKNVVYLTIEVVDPINTSLDLTATQLKLSADSSDKKTHYDLKLDFYEEIDTEKSHKNTDNGSHIYLVLRKKEAKEEYWPRLTKEKLKYFYIKTDFDKWVDEDEQNEQEEQPDEGDMSNMMNLGGGGTPDLSQLMQGAGGAGGAGGAPDFSQLMQGAGGAGGAPDFSQLMQGAGGAGGNFDISSLASQLGEAGANLDGNDGAEDDDESDEKVEAVN